jgi:hypothetical protein
VGVLADSSSNIVEDAGELSHGLMRFSSKVGCVVDEYFHLFSGLQWPLTNHGRIDFALHHIEAADSQQSIRRFRGSYPFEAATKDIVTQTFTLVMNTLSVNMQYLALEAEELISDLSRPEEGFSTCSRSLIT